IANMKEQDQISFLSELLREEGEYYQLLLIVEALADIGDKAFLTLRDFYNYFQRENDNPALRKLIVRNVRRHNIKTSNTLSLLLQALDDKDIDVRKEAVMNLKFMAQDNLLKGIRGIIPKLLLLLDTENDDSILINVIDLFGDLKSPVVIKRLLKLLHTKDLSETLRERVFYALTLIYREASLTQKKRIERAISALSDDEGYRERAIYYLGEIGYKGVFETLKGMLIEKPDPAICRLIMQICLKNPELKEEGVRVLFSAIKQNPTGSMYIEEYLTKLIEQTMPIGFLVEILRGKDERFKIKAMQALFRISEEGLLRVREEVRAALGGNPVADEVLTQLSAKIGDLDVLKVAIYDKNPDVRIAAAIGLKRLGSKAAEEILKKALAKEKTTLVRVFMEAKTKPLSKKTSRELLRFITSKLFFYPLAYDEGNLSPVLWEAIGLFLGRADEEILPLIFTDYRTSILVSSYLIKSEISNKGLFLRLIRLKGKLSAQVVNIFLTTPPYQGYIEELLSNRGIPRWLNNSLMSEFRNGSEARVRFVLTLIKSYSPDKRRPYLDSLYRNKNISEGFAKGMIAEGLLREEELAYICPELLKAKLFNKNLPLEERSYTLELLAIRLPDLVLREWIINLLSLDDKNVANIIDLLPEPIKTNMIKMLLAILNYDYSSLHSLSFSKNFSRVLFSDSRWWQTIALYCENIDNVIFIDNFRQIFAQSDRLKDMADALKALFKSGVHYRFPLLSALRSNPNASKSYYRKLFEMGAIDGFEYEIILKEKPAQRGAILPAVLIKKAEEDPQYLAQLVRAEYMPTAIREMAIEALVLGKTALAYSSNVWILGKLLADPQTQRFTRDTLTGLFKTEEVAKSLGSMAIEAGLSEPLNRLLIRILIERGDAYSINEVLRVYSHTIADYNDLRTLIFPTGYWNLEEWLKYLEAQNRKERFISYIFS
ncbi:MAG: hypothetical protein FJZ16_08450, partial [Candidatus Omnitrophica bacterium]|nr:hypothetical protein [Candidatus Omnitrophota bacterium]